ncbi:nucleoside triphosphate pyrophosphohydrolase [Kineosporia succinea]|uniref:XTP/dITP diphosphohydrolase n=1 Tax=Kineosporia succinea TaxID=84632 RepID=A0ABT9NYU2_9ACTN|nr:MazG family protein [Kineosporia succinea]MDP9825597.1 XTP/dITP diphosphohydrolase [Kineosporia succinea]
MAARVTVLLTSPRTAPGLLSFPAWERLRAADAVLAADPDPAWQEAFSQAGVSLEDVSGVPVALRAGRLVEEAADGRELVWWGSEDGDPGLTDALAEHLSRRAVASRPPEVEVLTGSYDMPGARLLDLVAVMDTLRSPGGCPWDAEQTHTSLLPYLLEEAHEVIEAVESDDAAHLEEELGDLLLQVVFHARVAQDGYGFGIDEVAAGIVAKLIRRHPHVFSAAGSSSSAAEVEETWEMLKATEKAGRSGFEGIPATLPALARAQKMLGRLSRAGVDVDVAVEKASQGDELAAALLRVVVLARASGADAEASLRAALGRLVPPEQ